MSNALTVIRDTIQSDQTMGKLMLALGGRDGDPNALNEAKRYAASVLAEVEKTAGDKNKDLTVCNPQSIAQCMIDAARFKMFIDGRQHAHLIKYGNSATLQIGFRGYIAKIKENYPDADFTVELIFDGDKLEIWEENGFQNYTLKRANAFNQDLAKFLGVLVVISYTNGSRKVQKVHTVTKVRIDRARKAAKQDYVWSSDYFEKAKAAAIKAACKIHFAAIQGLQDVINYDNETHYDMEKPPEEVRAGSIIENLNQQLTNQATEESGSEVIDAEYSDEPAAPATRAELTAETAQPLVNDITKYLKEAMSEGDLWNIWDQFKEDRRRISKASKEIYAQLVDLYNSRMAELAGSQ